MARLESTNKKQSFVCAMGFYHVFSRTLICLRSFSVLPSAAFALCRPLVPTQSGFAIMSVCVWANVRPRAKNGENRHDTNGVLYNIWLKIYSNIPYVSLSGKQHKAMLRCFCLIFCIHNVCAFAFQREHHITQFHLYLYININIHIQKRYP